MVIDASTLVSAALKQDSVPEQALLRALDNHNHLVVSQEVEDEYREVMARPKLDRFVGRERRNYILSLILIAAERVEPAELIRECSDPNDDKYLSLAAAARANAIITGDEKHLLPMDPWRGIRIIRAAEFISLPHR